MSVSVRKAKILDVISRLGEASAQRVYDELREDVTINAVRMCLRNYYVQGLLKRKKLLGVYVYSLTGKGKSRLKYFRNKGII